jgi:pimeloyl-ACP methyl ester carboxylesterase
MLSDATDERVSLPTPLTVRASDGVEVSAYDLGGTGPDVVLVHATGFCAGVWTPVLHHLGDVRAVALDVRGHGRSDTPADGMDWHGTARDVLATVQGLDLDRPVGVGHSMGGASLLLAELTRPSTFGALWLYEPIVFPQSLAAPPDGGRTPNPLADGARRRRSRFDSAGDAYSHYAAKPPFSALHPAALAAYVEHGFRTLPDGSIVLRCDPETEASTYEMGMRHGAFEQLGSIRCPVTVLRGRAEAPGPATVAPMVADALPAGVLEDHPELGHFGPLEDPAAMAASMRSVVTAAP